MTVLGHGVPGWLAVVLGVLAVTGFCAAFVAAADLAERGRWRWRERRRPATVQFDTDACDAEAPDGDHCWFDAGHDGGHSWELREGLLLPPERTWEQMTSHQLPIVADLKRLGLPPDHDWDPGCRVRGCPVHGNWQEARERRAPWWEAEQRQAYAALNLDYPSGMLARIRDYTIN